MNSQIHQFTNSQIYNGYNQLTDNYPFVLNFNLSHTRTCARVPCLSVSVCHSVSYSVSVTHT